ncbi:MAG TPA: RidA family protein [Pyrinomonadaceae bacterium]|nr:RidA family protein [Pyrinomonadaceae bacterium]
MNTVKLQDAPEPVGHYSPAIISNGFIFVSGQLPRDIYTGEVETGHIAKQTELALNNVKRIIQAAGSDLDHVVQVTIYVSDIELWDEVNRVYSEFFGRHKPARVIVPVKDLHFGTKIEVQAIASVKD